MNGWLTHAQGEDLTGPNPGRADIFSLCFCGLCFPP
ncbi:unnamed protein product, partial [Gulo gulo]